MSIKTQKLLDLDYYVDKVSLAMQNDSIFMKQIKDIVSYLQTYNNQILSFESALRSMLYDIISGNTTEIEEYKYTDLLDKIASIFNLSRKFVIDFKNPLTNEIDTVMKEAFEMFNVNVAHSLLLTSMNLTNNQLRLIIYCAIMKNSYDGSYEMLAKVYDTVCKFISYEIETATSWKILQITKYYIDVEGHSVPTSAVVDCLLAFNDYAFVENDLKSQYFTLFFGGFLTIQSAGIYYYYASTDLASLLYWSPEGEPASDTSKYCWSDDNDESKIRRWL